MQPFDSFADTSGAQPKSKLRFDSRQTNDSHLLHFDETPEPNLLKVDATGHKCAGLISSISMNQMSIRSLKGVRQHAHLLPLSGKDSENRSIQLWALITEDGSDVKRPILRAA